MHIQQRSSLVVVVALTTALLSSLASCFVVTRTPFHRHDALISTTTKRLFLSSRKRKTVLHASSSLVVISPPGGVGEVTAVKAAQLGSSVRWFVVSSSSGDNNNDSNSQTVSLSQETLDSIAAAGGSVELAGADAPSLLRDDDNDDPQQQQSALPAVATWCGAADAMVCTCDTGDDAVDVTATAKNKDDAEKNAAVWKNAIKVAVQEASKSCKTKLVILSFDEEQNDDMSSSEDEGLVGGLVGKFLGSNNKVQVPASLVQAAAMGSDNDSKVVTKLWHGQLFGRPESSPDFSPLVDGPKRIPQLTPEYTMRSVRVDPTVVNKNTNVNVFRNTRSSRHAVGEAAALMALQKVPYAVGTNVCVSSQRGTDVVPLELWQKEFDRVNDEIMQMSSSSSGGDVRLFSAEFASVPDVQRLADWLNTKWAPAVLRTYDIAGIRVGARPVFANRVDDDKVEIVWQQLVDFNSVTVGRMIIQVSDTGLVATRGPGDAAKGFGAISSKPLAGEDVLVRRLAEAASQAIEKGLAKKPTVAKKAKAPKPQPVEAVAAPVASIQSSGTVTAEEAQAPAPAASSDQGPRKSGARRSTERARGRRKRASKGSS